MTRSESYSDTMSLQQCDGRKKEWSKFLNPEEWLSFWDEQMSYIHNRIFCSFWQLFQTLYDFALAVLCTILCLIPLIRFFRLGRAGQQPASCPRRVGIWDVCSVSIFMSFCSRSDCTFIVRILALCYFFLQVILLSQSSLMRISSQAFQLKTKPKERSYG
jgi:hypothetical protein